MAEETSNVIVELHDLSLTERKDDRFGRVVTTRTNKVDDLIRIAVARRTDLNAATLKASYEILKSIALEELTHGASVEFGLGYNSLAVNGIFVGDHARWDSQQNSLALRVTPTAEVRNAVKNITVDVRGMASSGTFINTLTDVSSGETNTRLTPGGGVNLTGNKIKIAGDLPDIGIRLINQASAEETLILPNSLLTNDPSKVTFIVPSTLSAGDYRLSLTTQFSNSITLLKESRTYLFDYVLACI
jgi:hypothetical protein